MHLEVVKLIYFSKCMIRLNCSHDSSIRYCIEFVVTSTTNVTSYILDPVIRSRVMFYRENEVDFLIEERKVKSLAAMFAK